MLQSTVVFSYEDGLSQLIGANYPESIIANNMTDFLWKVSKEVTGILIIGNWDDPLLGIDNNAKDLIHICALTGITKPPWVPDSHFHPFDSDTFLTIIRGIVNPVQILSTKN